MRFVYIALVVLLTAAVLLFKFQNLSSVTLSFLSMNVTLPVSVMVIGVYVLGMVTGGALLSLVRGWVRGARVRGRHLSRSHSGPRPQLADFWRQRRAHLIGFAFAEFARKDLEHGRYDAFDLVFLQPGRFLDNPMQKLLLVPILLRLVGEMPPFEKEASDEHRELRGKLYGLRGRQTVPQRVQNAAQCHVALVRIVPNHRAADPREPDVGLFDGLVEDRDAGA